MISDNLRRLLLEFRSERDWEQFHSARTLSIAISVEAAELLEHFQWIPDAEIADQALERKDEIGEEIADLAILLTYLSHDLSLDMEEIVQAKLKKNAEKYPVEKFKGSAKKYSRI